MKREIVEGVLAVAALIPWKGSPVRAQATATLEESRESPTRASGITITYRGSRSPQ